jgi:hypothetical protein
MDIKALEYNVAKTIWILKVQNYLKRCGDGFGIVAKWLGFKTNFGAIGSSLVAFK